MAAVEENYERVHDSLEFFVYAQMTREGPNGTTPSLDDGFVKPLIRVVVELILYDEEFVASADRLIVMLPKPQQKKKRMMMEAGLSKASTVKPGPVVFDADIDRRFSSVLHVRSRTYNTSEDSYRNNTVVNEDGETMNGLSDGGKVISGQITVCCASRCAIRVFVMSNTSVRWHVINNELNHLRKRPCFKAVYGQQQWRYIVRSFRSRNFTVDIAFAFATNIYV